MRVWQALPGSGQSPVDASAMGGLLRFGLSKANPLCVQWRISGGIVPLRKRVVQTSAVTGNPQ